MGFYIFVLFGFVFYLYLNNKNLSKQINSLDFRINELLKLIERKSEMSVEKNDTKSEFAENYEGEDIGNVTNFTEEVSPSSRSIKENFSPKLQLYSDASLLDDEVVALDSNEINYHPKVVAEKIIKKESKEFFLVSWFKDNTLIKVGSIIFFLGAAWLVSYAIIVEFVSPSVLIYLGFVLAIVSYFVAVKRKVISVSQYLTLTTLGTAIVGVTVFSAPLILDFFNPLIALSILALSIVYTIYVVWKTNARRLAVAVCIAGLLAPVLVGAMSEPVWLLLYLLVQILGFLFISFELELRPVTLISIIGLSFYEIALLASFSLSTNVLWFFVVIFSILFFISVSVSIVRSKLPQGIDVLNFALVGLVFILFASQIALSSTLATFIATLVIGAVGYYLMIKNFPIQTYAIYIAFASVGLLVATSFAFSGYTETLVYILEITTIFFIVTYLGLPFKVVRLIAFGYLLPLFASLASFGASDWNYSEVWRWSVFHEDAIVLYAMSASLVGTTLWLLHKKTIVVHSWSKMLASIFGAVSFLYLLPVVYLVMHGIFLPDVAMVMTYVLWSIMSVSLVYYTIKVVLPHQATIVAVCTLLIPMIASSHSLYSSVWHEGVVHVHGFGIGVIFATLILTILLITQLFYVEFNQSLKTTLGAMIIATVLYMFAALGIIFDTMFTRGLSLVASYSSYMFILYALISTFVLFRTNAQWLFYALLALAWPLLLSLGSFYFGGWSRTEISHALGLFVVIVLLIMIAVGIKYRYHSETVELQKKVSRWSHVLFAIAGLYSIGYLWSFSHSFFHGGKAVAISLFVYTIIGLYLYQFGRLHKRSDFYRAGQALLIFVFLRLILIDVWGMELLWRIITFLGVGALFIGTALLEKPKPVDESGSKGIEG